MNIAADRPVDWVASTASRSRRTTDRSAASSYATEAPAMPPPTTTTSQDCTARACHAAGPRRLLVEHAPREVHERVAQQLDLDAVRVLEVHRLLDAHVRTGVLDAGRVEPVAQLLPAVARDRDGDVLDAADRLHARLEPEGREV